MENEYLCFINLIGKDVEDIYTYEFIFTDDPDTFWAEDFEVKPIGLCSTLNLDEDTYNLKKLIKTKVKLDLIQFNCCFSMQDCMDGIVSLAWQNIDDLDEYPENGRIVFNYGDKYDDVETMLAENNILLEDE